MAPETHLFQIGDPILLFFAKILIEIDQGKKIPITISPAAEENRHAWFDLLCYLDKADVCQGSLYLDAVRACLQLRSLLPRPLRRRQGSRQKGQFDYQRNHIPSGNPELGVRAQLILRETRQEAPVDFAASIFLFFRLRSEY